MIEKITRFMFHGFLYLFVGCYICGFVFRFLVLVKLGFYGLLYFDNLILIVSMFSGIMLMKITY